MKTANAYYVAACGISSSTAFFQAVSIFDRNFVWNTSHSTKRARYYNSTSGKVGKPVIIVRFCCNLYFLETYFFRKILKYLQVCHETQCMCNTNFNTSKIFFLHLNKKSTTVCMVTQIRGDDFVFHIMCYLIQGAYRSLAPGVPSTELAPCHPSSA